MKPVTLYKPTSLAEATQILAHHGHEAAVYAGGTDLLIRLKNRLNAAPKYLVDIKTVADLKFIRETPDGGLAIGATNTITEVADSPLVNGLLTEPFRLENGKLRVPTAPGLGIELAEDALERMRIP